VILFLFGTLFEGGDTAISSGFSIASSEIWFGTSASILKGYSLNESFFGIFS